MLLAIEELGCQDEIHYELTRRLANAVVGAGNNKKLAQSFNKFFPPYRDKKGSAMDKAQETLKKFREIEARKKSINGAGS